MEHRITITLTDRQKERVEAASEYRTRIEGKEISQAEIIRRCIMTAYMKEKFQARRWWQFWKR